MTRIERARRLALELAERPFSPQPPERARRRRTVALGDPQASVEKLFAGLELHGLLGEDGRLLPDVCLVSIGDHFDFNGELGGVARSGLAFLSWLAAHPPDQAVILAGNHDLARVMELAGQTDASFLLARSLAAAHAEASRQQGPERDDAVAAALAAFQAHAPRLPTPEVATRDYSSFTEAQGELVRSLLVAGRFRLGCAATLPDGTALLLTHAAVTLRELGLLGLPEERSPAKLAAALDHLLTDRVSAVAAAWSRGEPAALDLAPLQDAGSAGREGGGMLYHRPGHPERGGRFEGPAPRRFHPERLPQGLVQAAGHTGHRKCCEELLCWVAPAAAARERGGLRTLTCEAGRIRYDAGLVAPSPGGATLYLIEPELSHVSAEALELLELGSVS